MSFRFLPAARWDLIDAADWYERQSAGLGDDFTNQVENRVQEIATRPRLYGGVKPAVRGREVREAPVHRFPYKVVYEVTAAEVVIVAVVHVRRGRRSWRPRLSTPTP